MIVDDFIAAALLLLMDNSHIITDCISAGNNAQ